MDSESSMLKQLLSVGHDNVRPVLAQRVGLPHPVNADDETETTGASGLHPGERILEHHGLLRLYTQRASTGEERVRRGLAPQMLTYGDDTVDACVEQILNPGRDQHIPAVGARRHHCPRQPGIANRTHVADGSLVDLHAVAV